jgi:hypothetical protein
LTRCRNWSVLARNSASLRRCVSGSSALIRSMSGRKRLISRSFLVPNILAKMVSSKNLFPYARDEKITRSF